MEFVVSRAVLCIGGVIMLVAVAGAVSGMYDMGVDDNDRELTERFAGVLDSFESSQMDVLILEGPGLLPGDCYVSVHDGLVELFHGEATHIAETKYSGEFTMDCTETVEITHRRSPRSSLQYP